MTTAADLDILPKQEEFLLLPNREVLYSGAFAAGKTRSVCLKCAARAVHKGARELLSRKHLVTLKATTLKTLLEPDGHLPPVLPKGSYIHNKTDKTIRIKNGGEIVYAGLDDPAKIGSYNLSGAAVDEAVELLEEDWTMLLGRIRLDVGIPRQIYGACNPGSPSHFLAKRFGLALDYVPHEGCVAVRTKSTDNHFLPRDYVASLLQLTGTARKRYVDGLWVGSDQLVYDTWDRTVFVQERTGPWARCWIGCDDGYTNPAVLLLICEDSDGRLHVAREWYRSGTLEPQRVQLASEWQRRHQAEVVVADPSAAGLIAAMRNAGVDVVEAVNEVFAGLMSVRQRLVVAGDGVPRLTVDPSCQNVIREFETYEHRVQKSSGLVMDEPLKEHDHAMDALRYAVVYRDGLWSPPLVLTVEQRASVAVGPVTVEVESDRFLERLNNPEIWGETWDD